MRFEWDEDKNRANLAKHGVGFEAATLVFDDPLHVTRQDRIENGELRWQTVGMAIGVSVVVVAHTLRDGHGDEIVRIISARKATPTERKRYEESHT